jgi:hypothetical protein
MKVTPALVNPWFQHDKRLVLILRMFLRLDTDQFSVFKDSDRLQDDA